jgi:hypothetical protein
VFHCRGTVRLVQDRVATPLPATLQLLRDVTADIITCSITVTLINCLPCRYNILACTTLLFILPRDNLPDGMDAIDFAGQELVLITSQERT